ncbi:Na+/H+ antiporter subunit E [Microbulbifer celer]|uniref:Na+/H+ antiporter subunit E n=1 Tax=Microbulbifer celer TaxID=435905 RepID=A0ABW3U988_9GAMM|nr:Na+/H+ antiporter subunit E [Microbulbifer celer]UFN57585.1 Na+/H+ antiporter subunit E [Microbulbifer celer]
MRYTLCLVAVLAFIWLANSGHYTPLILGFGLLSVFFVVLVARRMKLVDGESLPLQLWSTLPTYYLWLFKKIVASNLEVTRCVWSGLLPGTGSIEQSITPASARLPTVLRTDLGKAMYANSITLTPGTVAIDIDGSSVLVHALTGDGLAELREGEMERRVKRLTEEELSEQSPPEDQREQQRQEPFEQETTC